MAVTMNKISLKEIISLCDSMCGLVNSLSDHRSLVMVIGNGGEVTFSKQALHIYAESQQDHPIQKLVVKTALQFHAETGHDCKVFMLLLKEIMNGVKDLLSKLEEIEVRVLMLREISALMHHIPVICDKIKASNAFISVPSSKLSKDLEGILLTFLESKFSLRIAKELSILMRDFIMKSIHDWDLGFNYLHYIETNFNVFCSKFSSPVSKSRVLQGFVLNHRLNNTEISFNDTIKYVVVESLPKKIDETVVIVTKDTLQPSCYWKSFDESLCSLKAQGVSAIITPEIACEKIKALCLQNKILIISNIEKEDIENIILCTGISPVTYIHDSLSLQNIGCLKSIQAIENYTYLETLSNTSLFCPHHILLGAQIESVWKEYYNECQNCLKVVKLWMIPENNNFPFKLNDERQKQLFANNSFESKLKATMPLYGVALPLGSFELYFWKTLKTFPEETALFPNLNSILNCALLKVACQIWEIPISNFNVEKSLTNFLQEKKLLLNYPVEPFLIKELHISKVLQLVQQLIRLDAILPSGK